NDYLNGTLDEVAIYHTALSAARVQAHYTAGHPDTTAPTITLTTPTNGNSSALATPAFSGVAGTAAGDLTNAAVKIYSGSTPTGLAVETLSAAVAANGA